MYQSEFNFEGRIYRHVPAKSWIDRIRLVPFEGLVSILAIMSALTFWLNPHDPSRSIGVLAHPWDYIWATMYGLSGLLLLFGIGSNSRNVEMAGLAFLAGGVFIQAAVLFAVTSFAASIVAFIYYFSTMLACFFRYKTLRRKRVMLVLEETTTLEESGYDY